MIDSEQIRRIVEGVLSESKADATEVLVYAGDSHLTRFANSVIHQNVSERDVQVRVRAIAGRRQGVATTNDLRPEALARVAAQALEAATFQPPRETDILLAAPAAIRAVEAYSEATAGCSPAGRARAGGEVCRLAESQGLEAAGAYSTGVASIGIGNSRGLFAFHQATRASFNTVVMGQDSSGYAESASWDMGRLDVEALGREAIETALSSRRPRAVDAGEYPVILLPYAVCDILGTLGYIGFGALAVQEGRSFMAGEIGRRVASPLVTIYDDGLDTRGTPMPFDFEGVPKQRVGIVERGIATSAVYDLETAMKEGRQSTGHGLPAPNDFGPMPLNLFMEAGEASLEEMLASMERGILVTRFHYTVPVHEQKTITTGMTRDGTFWIEGGEIAYPLKNLRFTQSYIGALNAVEQVGRDTRLLAPENAAVLAPALKIGAFRFTSGTEF